MKEIILLLILTITLLVAVINKKNEKIKILENNWETAKKVIGEFDPSFKEYIDSRNYKS